MAEGEKLAGAIREGPMAYGGTNQRHWEIEEEATNSPR